MALGLGLAMGLNFASGFLNGVQSSNKYLQQSAIYQQQADIYRRNAALTRLNGARNEDILRAQNRAYLSRSRAAAGEAGMGESATMMSLLASSASALEQNVLDARMNVESEAENYLYQAALAEENNRIMRKKSKNAFRSGLVSGISSSLGLL